MASSRGGPRRRIVCQVATVLYGLFLATAAFAHHDLLCHFKTPQHCTACTSSVVGPSPGTRLIVSASPLPDAGWAVAFELPLDDTLLAVHAAGRSPPCLA